MVKRQDVTRQDVTRYVICGCILYEELEICLSNQAITIDNGETNLLGTDDVEAGQNISDIGI